MNVIGVQLSVYALSPGDQHAAVQAVVAALEAHGLSHEVGPMSTFAWGESEVVFAALRGAWEAASRQGSTVLHVALTNACPLPAASQEGQHHA